MKWVTEDIKMKDRKHFELNNNEHNSYRYLGSVLKTVLEWKHSSLQHTQEGRKVGNRGPGLRLKELEKQRVEAKGSSKGRSKGNRTENVKQKIAKAKPCFTGNTFKMHRSLQDN